MNRQNNQERIEFTQIATEIDTSFLQADILRNNGLQGLQRVLKAKLTGQNRELERLRDKLGNNNARVNALSTKIKISPYLDREATININRSQIEKPKADENKWILYGMVYSKEVIGIPNLTVGLYDSNGKWLESFGTVETGKTGYFRLDYVFSKENSSESSLITPKTIAQRFPNSIFIRLKNKEGILLYIGKRSLIPAPGKLEFREMILGDDPDVSAQTNKAADRSITRTKTG